MYLPTLRSDISQGDIFTDVPFPYVIIDSSENVIPKMRYKTAMLVSHSCDYDKRTVPQVLVAQVRSVSELSEGDRGNIRSLRMLNTFYLPMVDGVMEESYVDFRIIVPVSKSIIATLSANDKRILSISDTHLQGSPEIDLRTGLWQRLSYFFGPRDNDLINAE